MNIWRYQILEYNVKGGQIRKIHIEEDYKSQLNKLGADGWELAGIIHFTEDIGCL